jgi:hypothetical protein
MMKQTNKVQLQDCIGTYTKEYDSLGISDDFVEVSWIVRKTMQHIAN